MSDFKWKIFSNFVAFSEYPNFNCIPFSYPIFSNWCKENFLLFWHIFKRSFSLFQTFLDQSGFEFVTRCFQTLENRGLDDQGLYRVVGVASKVTKLLSAGLDKKRSEKINFDEPLEWETKTITSAAKTYLRNLPEPLMTFKMHTSFIAAASKFLTMKGSWFISSLVYLQYHNSKVEKIT